MVYEALWFMKNEAISFSECSSEWLETRSKIKQQDRSAWAVLQEPLAVIQKAKAVCGRDLALLSCDSF